MKNIKRIFAFGCSFTDYWWLTWPEILAQELKVPVYNYGLCGGGNTYIFNTFCQADAQYKFTSDDLIITAWTNVAREDRHIKGNWITPGNIYTQNIYSKKYVKNWADPFGYLVRDLAYIHTVTSSMASRNITHYNFQMSNIIEHGDQQSTEQNIADSSDKSYQRIINLYQDSLKTLKDSFIKVLWDDDITSNKDKSDKKYFSVFSDGHPLPLEHLKYLETVLSIDFSTQTKTLVVEKQENFISIINHQESIYKKGFHLFELSDELQNKIKKECKFNLELKPKVV